MSKSKGVGSYVVAGLAFGAALGIAAGIHVLAPHLPSNPAAGKSAARQQELENVQRSASISAAQADSADSVIGELSDKIVKDSLNEQSILLVTTPSAQDEDVKAIRDLLRTSGASDAGRIDLKARFFAAEGADRLESIVTNTLPEGAVLAEDRSDNGFHAGQALKAALIKTSDADAASDADRDALLGALKESGYLDYDQAAAKPANGVIVVTGDYKSMSKSDADGSASDAKASEQTTPSDGQSPGSDALAGESNENSQEFAARNLASMAEGFADKGAPIVVVGRITAAAEGGPLDILRNGTEVGQKVSTVDSGERAYGRIAAVLALRDQLSGHAGNYGSAKSAGSAVPGL